MSRNSSTGSAPEGADNSVQACLFTGVGSVRPTPRTKTMGMFGYIPDAFTSKSLEFNGDSSPRNKPSGSVKSTAPAETTEPTNDEADGKKEEVEQNGDVPEVEPEVEVDKPLDVFEGVS